MTPSLAPHLFSDVLAALAKAHGLGPLAATAHIDGFSFTPDGPRYQLRPHREDREQAWLEMGVAELEDVLTPQEPAQIIRLLRALLQLNDSLLNEHNWLISMDEDEQLVLSSAVSLPGLSTEALQLLALQGLQRAQAIRQLCSGLALERLESITLPIHASNQMV
jgi:hypothetical protein